MPQNIGNFTTLLKPHNIGTHLKGIEIFQVIMYHYFLNPSTAILGELYYFLKFSQNTFSL
jgi:hypothetical protein